MYKCRVYNFRGKIIVFEPLKRWDNVYTEIILDCSAVILQKVIIGKIYVGSVVLLWCKKHFRVLHSKIVFVRGYAHINGIELCCGYVKTKLMKFK